MLPQSDSNGYQLTQLEKTISYIFMLNQLGYYKYIRRIILNKIIKYLQTNDTNI